MAARQPALLRTAAGELPVDPGDFLRPALSFLADRLGLGWGTVLGLVLPTVVVAGCGVALAVWLWRRTSRTPSTSTGADQFSGRVVTVRTAQGVRGQVFVEGSWWSVRSAGPPLRVGQEVRVQAVDGLVLVVEDLAADIPKEEET